MSKQKKNRNEEIKENEPIETVEDDELPAVEEEVEVVIDPLEQKENEIAALKEELNKAKNDMARAYADTDNMRKRLQKETDMAKKYRFQSAALEFLPILDSMNLALTQVPESEEAKGFAKGFEMIRTQLESALLNEGVKEIDAQDKPFDHNTMQALMQEKVDGVDSGIVVEVLQKGYMLKDRILRPALVKVSE
ncbi:nucleotide exchange factor GrpE [Dubosiella muris]|uniref:Nucleotide exchange factor GrpE n=1 Tax=Dubosiella muris TaxID=3038133 RepID=A0AC61RAH5_9FIRM|nr:nucleotide exchange factor GrpE [Dubosiella muris]TGY67285.1 nucleotide exchange factor GrpE [Dubosiella muris]